MTITRCASVVSFLKVCFTCKILPTPPDRLDIVVLPSAAKTILLELEEACFKFVAFKVAIMLLPPLL